jgi:hypothetical protein
MIIDLEEKLIPTADLPEAGPASNGRVIIEDLGGGDYNFCVYINNTVIKFPNDSQL